MTKPSHRVVVVVRDKESFHFEIQQRPIPEIKPWEILVKLSVTGVCGTDIAMASGHLGPARDIVGHEGVGRIERIGSGVDPGTARIGDRVGIAWVRDVCGRCDCCRIPGGETRCVEQLNSGRLIDGTFAEYCVIPARYVSLIPESLGIEDELVAPVLCGGVTAYKALKSSGATPGSWIVILGAAGGVGALAIQYGRAMGYRIIAIDVGDKRKDFCLGAGAELHLDALEDDLPAKISKSTGGVKAKAVIISAASIKAFQGAFDLVAPFGTVICVGIPPKNELIKLHPLKFIDEGINLVGILTGTRTDTLEALEFVRRGVVVPSIIPIRPEELNDVVKNLRMATGKYVVRF